MLASNSCFNCWFPCAEVIAFAIIWADDNICIVIVFAIASFEQKMSILYYYACKRQNLAEYVSTVNETEVKSPVISKCSVLQYVQNGHIYALFSTLECTQN